MYDEAILSWDGRSLKTITVRDNNTTIATITYTYNDEGVRIKKVIVEGEIAYQVVTSVACYTAMAVGALFDENIRNDMNAIGWNPFNTDETATLNSNKISFYKGVPMFRVSSNKRSCSFVVISLVRGCDADELRHERGHNWQLMMMGLATYGFTLGIPSPLCLGKWDKSGNCFGAPYL